MGFVSWMVPGVVVLVVLGVALALRYMRHTERMELIRQGIVPPEPRQTGGRGRLLAGAITAAVGLALTLGLMTLGIGPWLVGGLVPLFVGLAILLVYFVMPGE